MSAIKRCAFVLLICMCVRVKSEHREPSFMAVSTIIEMMKIEEKVVDKMTTMIDLMKNMDIHFSEEDVNKPKGIVAAMTAYAERFQKMKSSGRSFEQIAYHPIDAYHLMKDVILGWNKIVTEHEKDENSITGLLTNIKGLRKEGKYPVIQDISTIGLSIARFQDFYNLKQEDIMAGIIVDPVTKEKFQSIRPLDAWDCLAIGGGATLQGLYGLAVDWMMAAKTLRLKGDKSVPLSGVETRLKDAIDVHDTTLIQKGWRGLGWRTHKLPIDKQLVEKFAGRLKMGQKEFVPRLFSHMGYEDLQEQQKFLCRGEELRPRRLIDQLHCRFVTNNDPYLRIGPFKVEELSKDLPVMMFHDFVYEFEIKRFIDTATPHIEDAKSYQHNEDGSSETKTGKERIAKNWDFGIHNDTFLVSKFIRRGEAAFKLRFKSMEHIFMKATNFGIGGQFDVHKDYSAPDMYSSNTIAYKREMMEKNGDVIANAVLHLGDVEAGGATVFPHIGLTVRHTKGAAVLWYNLNKAGQPDLGSYHGECPVLYGSKWTGIIKPALYDQMFTYKCGSHDLDKHTLL